MKAGDTEHKARHARDGCYESAPVGCDAGTEACEARREVRAVHSRAVLVAAVLDVNRAWPWRKPGFRVERFFGMPGPLADADSRFFPSTKAHGAFTDRSIVGRTLPHTRARTTTTPTHPTGSGESLSPILSHQLGGGKHRGGGTSGTGSRNPLSSKPSSTQRCRGNS